MFKLAKIREIEWPVTVHIPQDGGDVTKATFKARFEFVENEEFERIIRADADMWERLLLCWSGVADEDGHEIPFSTEERAKLVKIPYVRAALATAYSELQIGRAAARKN